MKKKLARHQVCNKILHPDTTSNETSNESKASPDGVRAFFFCHFGWNIVVLLSGAGNDTTSQEKSNYAGSEN
jgi:hypothetical protein